MALLTAGIDFSTAQQDGYYFLSEADIANIRESARTEWGSGIMEGMRRSVEERLRHNMEVPDLEAGHGHFYVCPVHNVTFTFRWEHPTAHLCEACGKEYRGNNRYNWGWVNFVHASNLTFLKSCAYLYIATGDTKYSDYIRDMLLDYAGKYPDWMVHDAWRKPTESHSGKMFGQSLDESVWFSTAARAYDAVSDTFTSEVRERIESRLFREAANLLLRRRDGGNWQVWHNCGLTALGIVLKDDGIINTAISDPECGYYHLADKHVYDDGWWNEGSPIYHFYPLGAMAMTADAVRCRGIDLFDQRFYNMFASPVKGTYPDLFFPAHNDGWYGESLVAQSDLYEFAYARFGDGLFYDVLRQCYRYKNRGGTYALLNPVEITAADSPMKLGSTRFEDAGFALLRSDKAVAVMKYGPHGGGHGHPDRLSISVHNYDREILSDFGTSAYGAPDYTRWYRKTLSHNTVTVDGKDQLFNGGSLVEFRDTKKGGMVEASADDSYEGVEMKRRLELSGAVLKDVFTCTSGEERTYDYVLVFNNPPVISGKVKDNVVWDAEPYAQVKNVERYEFHNGVEIGIPEATIRISAGVPFELFTGEASGIPPTNPGVRTPDGTEKRAVLPAYPVIIRVKAKDLKINAEWKIK